MWFSTFSGDPFSKNTCFHSKINPPPPSAQPSSVRAKGPPDKENPRPRPLPGKKQQQQQKNSTETTINNEIACLTKGQSHLGIHQDLASCFGMLAPLGMKENGWLERCSEKSSEQPCVFDVVGHRKVLGVLVEQTINGRKSKLH